MNLNETISKLLGIKLRKIEVTDLAKDTPTVFGGKSLFLLLNQSTIRKRSVQHLYQRVA